MNQVVETPHWFAIPGQQEGRRTLTEQMLGLHPALAEARGRSVVDFGCAEGLIAIEFAKAGAQVRACDYNASMIDTAKRLAEGVPNVEFLHADLREVMSDTSWRCDILLLLAVLHKMPQPQLALEHFADIAGDLMVIRLPVGSSGERLRSKHTNERCNVNLTMGQRGFALEKSLTGPRRERVQYWRRKK